jgi:dTDP-4-amino-4,6-dideoxygalactose transaminase
MNIKFLNLPRSYAAIQEEVNARIATVLSNANYIHGKEVTEFEQNFASYIGMRHCIGVANGTDALELAVQSLQLPKDSEIIVQGNTYIASCLGVVNNGHKLVICDCDPNTHMIDTEELKRKITPQTRVLILVHLFGSMPNMDTILEICQTNGIVLIEDCAQAHGATWKGVRAGSFGALSCFSFYPGKNLGAYGDGGAICVNDDVLEQRIRKLANLGCIVKYNHECIGRNSRLDTVQAAVLDTKLKYLDANNEKRRAVAAAYSAHLSRHVQVPVVHPDCVPVYHLYVIKVPFGQRDKLKGFLLENGVETGIHYPISITETKAFESLELGHPYYCIKNAKSIISLPIYPEMTEEEVDYVISKVNEYFQTHMSFTTHTVPSKPGLLHCINDIQFDTRRIFYVDSFNEHDCSKKRGFHANVNFNECIVIQNGSVEVELTNCMDQATTHTVQKGEVFYVPIGYWIEYSTQDPTTVMLVLADKSIEETACIYNKDVFLKA